MDITVSFKNNILPDKYSKKANDTIQGKPALSFPFEVTNIPNKTKTIAWTLVDYDSIPVCGFAYIHWVVANVPVAGSHLAIEEDFSRQDKVHTHGKNSLVSAFLKEDFSAIAENYTGPYPPDKDHIYTLTVYALDDELALSDGFYMNDLLKAVKNHTLAKAELEIIGKS